MIKAPHFVIDLETMGTRPTSAIVAIGCVHVENLQIVGEFYRRVELHDSLNAGLTVDGSTVKWWLEQSDEARKEITSAGVSLFEALVDLSSFMKANLFEGGNRRALLWGNGSSFDNVIVGNAFDAARLPRPWAFWNDRDLRTLLALHPEAKQLPFEGTKHHALHDAKHEAKQLIVALSSLCDTAAEEARA